MAKRNRVPDELRALGVPRIDQYFGLLAVEERFCRSLVDQVRSMDLVLHVREQKRLRSTGIHMATARDKASYPVTKAGVSIIELTGPLMKQVSSLSNGTSTTFARRQIRSAAADDEVGGLLLKFDSPGGTSSGTMDLFDDIVAAAKAKPVWAYCEDLCASAAYFAACGADQIFCNATALIGSIGTYMVLYDQSAAATMQGLKVHVLATGKYKGAGVPGSEITPEQLADFQRIVDETNALFLGAVSQGRGMDSQAVAEIADGRVHLAEAAVDLGLCDGVQSFDDTLSGLEELADNPSARSGTRANTRSFSMAKDKDKDNANHAAESSAAETLIVGVTGPATYQQIVAECVGADPPFICKQLEGGATIAQAQKAWMIEQNARVAKANAEAEALRAKGHKPGLDPITGGNDGSTANGTAFNGDAHAEFESKFDEELAKTKGNRLQAIRNVARKYPALHKAHVLGANVAVGRRLEKVTGNPFDR
jgi:signal peptide peptidase SppA